MIETEFDPKTGKSHYRLRQTATTMTREEVAGLVDAAVSVATTAEREACAVIAERWGETHGEGVTVNARNAGSKIARGIRQRSNMNSQTPLVR